MVYTLFEAASTRICGYKLSRHDRSHRTGTGIHLPERSAYWFRAHDMPPATSSTFLEDFRPVARPPNDLVCWDTLAGSATVAEKTALAATRTHRPRVS